MERIEQERSFKTTYYRAWDGEVFSDEESCIEYENTPSVLAFKNVQSFMVRKFYEGKLSIIYSESETPAYIFKPTCSEDIAALNRFLEFDEWGHERPIGVNKVDNYYIDKEVFVVQDGLRKAYLFEDMVNEFKKQLNVIINDEEIDLDYDDDEEKIIRIR